MVLSGWEVRQHGLPFISSLTLGYYLTFLCLTFLMRTKWHKICNVLNNSACHIFWPVWCVSSDTSLFYFCFSRDEFAYLFIYLSTISVLFCELLIFFIFLEVLSYWFAQIICIFWTFFAYGICIYIYIDGYMHVYIYLKNLYI